VMYRGSGVAGIKRPGCDDVPSLPSSAEVKNVWSNTSPPPVCCYGMDRDTFKVDCLLNPLAYTAGCETG
jgi:hypothetical protein